MLQAIIFDFDGTLADTVPALCEGVNLTMRQYGYPTHTEADILRFINNGARELIRRAMPAEYRSDEEQVTRVLADYDRLYGTVYLHTTHCYAGVREAVAHLHDCGFRIGVLSNKQDVFVKALCKQVLKPGSYDVAQGVVAGKPTKPDPYLSCLVARELGVEPSACAMVGDSDVDIHTAQNTGMLHIGVTWGFRDEEFLRAAGAARLVHDPLALTELIKELKETELC